MVLLVRVAAIASCLIILLVTCGAPLRMQSSDGLRGALAPAAAFTPFPAVELPTASQRAMRPTTPAVVPPTLAPLPSPGPVIDTIGLSGQYNSSPSGIIQPIDSQLGSVLDAYLQQLAASNFFSGAVLVAEQGQVLLSKGYGFANYETQQPASAQARFRLASVTNSSQQPAILLLQPMVRCVSKT
ncbi:serine hydrolase, partial [Candidatus Gracilibacteria bacterium]|nr:serine hydrolase [Candidatus Gracilibacteria bacterium]